MGVTWNLKQNSFFVKFWTVK